MSKLMDNVVVSNEPDKQATFPARLHVLLAQDAPYGLVIRRGPTKQVCFVGWNRNDDTFTLGQWLRGRIFERRSDLSPDGKLIIYFAGDGVRWWTAISRTPYLRAVGLWMQSHTWSGGGLFVNDREYWLNASYDYRCERKPEGLQPVPREKVVGECPVVYFPRLERDGWAFAGEQKQHATHVTIFEKGTPVGWTIRKLCHASTDHPKGKGCYWDEHQLVTGNQTLSFPDWEWADLDGERLVWAKDGKLFAGRLMLSGLVDEHELYDFNPMRFEMRQAPYE